jgi:hypothetical protein
MEIMLQKNFEISNLVLLSGRFSPNEFQEAVKNIVSSHKNYAVNNGEYIITTTKSIEVVNGEQILDVEVLLPVLNNLPIEPPFKYKESIKITNALYTEVENIMELQDAMNEVNRYIVNNQLQPITTAYLVQKNKDKKPNVEIYIGLNPNIV